MEGEDQISFFMPLRQYDCNIVWTSSFGMMTVLFDLNFIWSILENFHIYSYPPKFIFQFYGTKLRCRVLQGLGILTLFFTYLAGSCPVFICHLYDKSTYPKNLFIALMESWFNIWTIQYRFESPWIIRDNSINPLRFKLFEIHTNWFEINKMLD